MCALQKPGRHHCRHPILQHPGRNHCLHNARCNRLAPRECCPTHHRSDCHHLRRFPQSCYRFDHQSCHRFDRRRVVWLQLSSLAASLRLSCHRCFRWSCRPAGHRVRVSCRPSNLVAFHLRLPCRRPRHCCQYLARRMPRSWHPVCTRAFGHGQNSPQYAAQDAKRFSHPFRNYSGFDCFCHWV